MFFHRLNYFFLYSKKNKFKFVLIVLNLRLFFLVDSSFNGKVIRIPVPVIKNKFVLLEAK